MRLFIFIKFLVASLYTFFIRGNKKPPVFLPGVLLFFSYFYVQCMRLNPWGRIKGVK